MKRYLLSIILLLFVTLNSAYAQMNLEACDGLQQTRLNGGMYALVLSDLPVYEQASAGSPQIGTVSAGTQVYITSAPVCAEGVVWYQAMYRPLTGPEDFPFGYISEGADGNYSLEPVVQNLSLPASRQSINSSNITSISQVAQVEFGMIYQTSWSSTGQYWMLNGVGATWVYDVSAEQNAPLRFSQNPYDTNAVHGMTIRDSEFIMVGSVSPVSESQQFGSFSFSLMDGTSLGGATLLPQNYSYIGAVNPEGTIAAAADWNGEIYLYDLATASQISNLSGHSLVGMMQFSPDGRYLLSLGGYGMAVSDTTVRVWDVATGSQIGMLDTGEGVTPGQIGFTPDSTQVVLKQPTVARLDFYSPELALLNSIELPTVGLTGFAFSADGSLLVLATVEDDAETVYSYGIAFYDMNAGSIVHTMPIPAMVKSLAFSPDSTLLAIIHEDPDFWGPNRATLWAVSAQ